jgi:hypothetical protein
MNLTQDELHAFVIGFSETLCPWKPYYHNQVPVPSPLKGEYHYYLAGRGFGFIALLLILTGIAKLFKEVLL